MMPYWKYRRLMRAVDNMANFSLFVDLVSLALFMYMATATVNKLLVKKITTLEILDPSWLTLCVCAIFFLLIASTRIYTGRELSEFEREATIKSSRKYNSRYFRGRF